MGGGGRRMSKLGADGNSPTLGGRSDHPSKNRELDDWKLFKSQSMRIDANTAVTFSLEEA